MVIGIKVIAENFKQGTVKHTNTSYFTMVAKNEGGAPTEVPGLILETREELKRFLEAIKRRELKSQYKRELQNARVALLEDHEQELLEGERVRLRLQ
jgi:acyl-CoA hydrolase